MSYYYKQQFVSPEPLYAKIKEELKSYFNTGSVDDLLFSLWTEDCLKKLGKGSLKLNHTILFLDGYQAKLPPDFHSVREAWVCGPLSSQSVRQQGAKYSSITTKLNDNNDRCNVDCCYPEAYEIIYKTTLDEIVTTNATYLLRPGNLETRKQCATDCLNFESASPDIFDIHGNKFVTNFREGEVYLIYYSTERTDEGYQLIPDGIRTKNYIESYIKYKVFEQLWNQVTDETYNQVTQKFQYYSQKKDEDYVMAETEAKKQTIEQKRNSIIRQYHKLDKYNIR